MDIFSNLKDLKNDMVDKAWCIDSFVFKYKQQEYIVLVKLYMEDEKVPKFALLKLEFLKRNNILDKLITPANAVTFLIDAKTLRNYFGIPFGINVGDAIQSFYQQFSNFIPKKVNTDKAADLKVAMIASLSESDKDDPNKIYCYSVKRNSVKSNGEYGKRSPYNDNKARILRPTLYEKLKTEIHVSFNFSTDPNKHEEDGTILFNWSQNNSM
ncbi:hypothetical protein COD78_18115 [Bacillus cereus]|uniref:DUF6037 family protein n=1 Tax=Bacillus cereus TaxID=1396 RepID=UPI000BF62DBC|nr:hypothetical protein CN454_26085 [Bacillus cereus]PGV20806.1 hypothetical protein COD78_18115 [Bacillus cereus]